MRRRRRASGRKTSLLSVGKEYMEREGDEGMRKSRDAVY